MDKDAEEKNLKMKYHDQIFEMLNTRLSETFKFYTPLIAAITALGYAWAKSLEASSEVSNSSPQNYSNLIEGAVVIAVFLLNGGILYIVATSYTYRVLQMVLAKLEAELGLKDYAPNWDPQDKLKDGQWSLYFFWIIPEILKAHFFMLGVAAILISIGYWYYIGGSKFLMFVLLSLTFITIFIPQYYYISKLTGKSKA